MFVPTCSRPKCLFNNLKWLINLLFISVFSSNRLQCDRGCWWHGKPFGKLFFVLKGYRVRLELWDLANYLCRTLFCICMTRQDHFHVMMSNHIEYDSDGTRKNRTQIIRNDFISIVSLHELNSFTWVCRVDMILSNVDTNRHYERYIIRTHGRWLSA